MKSIVVSNYVSGRICTNTERRSNMWRTDSEGEIVCDGGDGTPDEGHIFSFSNKALWFVIN